MTQLATRQDKSLALHTEMIQPWINVIGQVAPSSKQSYTFSAVTFHDWLLDHQHTLETVDRSGMIAYRDFLASRHAKATAARKWSVACQLLRGLCCKKQADLVKSGKTSKRGPCYDRTASLQMASLSVREHSLVRPLVFTLPVKLSAT